MASLSWWSERVRFFYMEDQGTLEYVPTGLGRNSKASHGLTLGYSKMSLLLLFVGQAILYCSPDSRREEFRLCLSKGRELEDPWPSLSYHKYLIGISLVTCPNKTLNFLSKSVPCGDHHPSKLDHHPSKFTELLRLCILEPFVTVLFSHTLCPIY